MFNSAGLHNAEIQIMDDGGEFDCVVGNNKSVLCLIRFFAF